MSNSLPTPVASMQVTLKTGDQRTKCLPEPDAALHSTNKIKTTTAKTKKVYLSQMLLYMDLKVLASSREGGVAPWAVHLFMFISLFFLKIRDLSIVRLLLFLIFRFRMLRLL